MCPVCLAALTQIVVVAASTSGLATLALKVSRKKNSGKSRDQIEAKADDEHLELPNLVYGGPIA